MRLENEAALKAKEEEIRRLKSQLNPLPGIIIKEQKERAAAQEAAAKLQEVLAKALKEKEEEAAKIKREAESKKQRLASDPLLRLRKRAKKIDQDSADLKTALTDLCTELEHDKLNQANKGKSVDEITASSAMQVCGYTHTLLDALSDPANDNGKKFDAIQLYKDNCKKTSSSTSIAKRVAAVVIAAIVTVFVAAFFATLGGTLGGLAAGPIGSFVGFFVGAVAGTAVGLDLGVELGSKITGVSREEIQNCFFFKENYRVVKQAKEVAKAAESEINLNM